MDKLIVIIQEVVFQRLYRNYLNTLNTIYHVFRIKIRFSFYKHIVSYDMYSHDEMF